MPWLHVIVKFIEQYIDCCITFIILNHHNQPEKHNTQKFIFHHTTIRKKKDLMNT